MITVNGENKNIYTVSIAFIVMIIVSLTLSLIVQGVLSLIVPSASITFICISSLCSPVSMCIILILLGKREKTNYLFVKNEKPLNISAVLFAVMLFVGMFLGFGFINYLFSDILNKIGIKVSSPVIAINNFWQFLLCSFCLCVVPAVFEELFFRNFFITGLKKLSVLSVILIDGLMFSLYHRSLSQLLYQFIFGVNLALLYLKTKNVIPCITAHFLNNFIVVLFLFLKININFYSAVNIIIGLLILSAFYLFIFVQNKGLSTKNEKTVLTNNFFIPFGIVGILLCLLYIVLGAVSI